MLLYILEVDDLSDGSESLRLLFYRLTGIHRLLTAECFCYLRIIFKIRLARV